MDALGKPEDYSAFYVACHSTMFDLVSKEIIKEKPKYFLICSEISPQSHLDTSGHHIHVLATLDDIQYRRIIHNLKKLLNLRGRATKEASRSYGKVKIIRDLLKMGAYTLKQQDPSGYVFSNFPEDILKEMMSISYQKESENDFIPQLMDYITSVLPRIEERNAYKAISQENVPYQTQQEDHHIKQAIIEFYVAQHCFSRGPPMKLPTKCKVHYYSTLWALEHSGWDPDKIVYYFYR